MPPVDCGWRVQDLAVVQQSGIGGMPRSASIDSTASGERCAPPGTDHHNCWSNSHCMQIRFYAVSQLRNNKEPLHHPGKLIRSV